MAEIRLPAERRDAAELAALIAADPGPRPPGWAMTPRAVRTYLVGSDAVGGVPIRRKYVGDASILEVAIATLASDRALMLIGEPGTAKSWIAEHLAAAISGDSTLVVQGTAGTTEEQLKYGWNYALLLAEGPSPKALVASPILRAMREGRIARFEEVTRTAPEVQDALISILSEKMVAVPELGETVFAQRGFAVIGTANTRDRGVNEMSSALKRRFNFVVVPVIDDLEREIAIVKQREAELRVEYGVGRPTPDELVKLLVTVFQELRSGLTADGKVKLRKPSAVLSTAEAISTLFQGGILAEGFGDGRVGAGDVARALVGSVLETNGDDGVALREYVETVAKGRPEPWKGFAAAVKKQLR